MALHEPLFYFKGPEVDSLMARYKAKLQAGDADGAIDLLSRDELKMTDEQVAFMRSTPAWEVLVSLAPTFPAEWRPFGDSIPKSPPTRVYPCPCC